MPVSLGVQGAGLGVRRAFAAELLSCHAEPLPDFVELVPENWIGLGGERGRQLSALTERWPAVAHGLSLSLGGPDVLDHAFIAALKTFLDRHRIACFSEHLSYCSAGGHLYDLMPLPFTAEAVHYTAARIREVQDRLQRRIAVENIVYYAAPCHEMTEAEFIAAVIEEADCDLLLDINNIVVNSINHGYDAANFLPAMPLDRVVYVHVAGHEILPDGLRLDTHGAAPADSVWLLLQQLYQYRGALPTVLERDSNLPPLGELLQEVDDIRALQLAVNRAEMPHAG